MKNKKDSLSAIKTLIKQAITENAVEQREDIVVVDLRLVRYNKFANLIYTSLRGSKNADNQ